MSERTNLRVISPEALENLRITVLELFSKHRFHEVGIREICKQAQVSPKTIYKYFGNKDQLVLACIEKDVQFVLKTCAQAAMDKAGSSTIEQGLAFIGAGFDCYVENRTLAMIVFANIPPTYWVGHPDFILNEVLEFGGRIVQEGQERGEIWDGLPPVQLTHMSLGMIHRTVLQLLTSEDASPEELKNNLLAAVRKLMSPK